MTVAVFISHNGQSLSYERPDVDLDAFRQWIESEAAIPPSRQILMNGRGRNVKNLKNESEIFVYDKKTLLSDAQPPPDRIDSLPEVPPAATEPADPSNGDSWKELFEQQRQWSLDVVDTVRNGADRVEAMTLEADAISRSIATALENLNNYVDNLARKFEASRQWAADYLIEQKESLNDWESSRRVLLEVPIREDLGQILGRAAPPSQQISTLGDLVDEDSLRSAEASLKASSADFESQLDRLTREVGHLKQETGTLRRHIVQVQDAGVEALVQEADAVAQPIVRDRDELVKVGDGDKAASIGSRKNAIHVSELIPGLEGILADLRQLYSDCLQTRNEAARACFTALTEISSIQSKLSRLQVDISQLEFKDEASLHTLGQVFQLPSVYGCSLVEAARRSEWTHRMQTDVDMMHDSLSQMTNEEQRRRKKWNTSYADFLKDDPNAGVALIDLQASKPRNTWPLVDRSEIFTYLDDLRALGIDDAVKNITQMLKDLDAPTRRKASVFNNGSVHDLASSSVVKNGDDLRVMQEQKRRLEEKLKASESRVRKLEDVLHRQSQLSRPPGSTFSGGYSDFDARTMSPVPFTKQTDFTSRPSISLRRASGASDEKAAAAQRIMALEAELQQIKEDAHVERQSNAETRDKMIEAESIKQDLMANLDAQKQEFEDERQLLDDENHKLKIRIEELEDELDRVIGSKEHYKLTKEEQIDQLKHQLSEEKRLSAERIRHVERRAEEGLAVLRDRAATLERQLSQHREERNSARDKNVKLATQLRSHEEQQQDLIIALQNAHSNLSPAGAPPEELKRLADALEILSEGAAIHARGLDDSLQLVTAEKKSLEERIEGLQREKEELEERLEASRGQHHMAEQMMKMARSNEASAREEIKAIQQELNCLRDKLAAGESGSGALRDKLLSEQQRAEELANAKLANERTIQELHVEADTARKEAEESAIQMERLKSKLRSRGEKAQRLSERLYQYNDRIIRMLEQFGYSITRQDGGLVIQRASKVNSASTMLTGVDEPGSTLMKRTVSGGVPTPHYSDPKDLETLYWTSDTEGDEDAKYRDFLTAIQRLQLDSTMETIAKRYKDVETLAKRYQKESRAYREKSHRFQAEAHDKIAYRSFKENDLALFLPTRNQATRPWAAFNVGAPHYFLREQDAHKLQSRDWLLARITKVEERVVDLSRSLVGGARLSDSTQAEASETASIEDENPFELSDGLRWYMIDAAEERPGAPGTPSVGKSTVTASTVEVKAQMGRKDKGGSGLANAVQATKHLNRSLESRRSSSASKRSLNVKKDSVSLKDTPTALAPIAGSEAGTRGESPIVAPASEEDNPQRARADDSVFDVVRTDLMMGG
ncbi:hypothetical protein DV735_g3620, partial [Chaetothyriales sp. CBS 134920]